MKGIILSERIRYVHCDDEEGNHGILVLLGNDRYPTKTFEVNDQADFRLGFRNLKIAEDTQAELELPIAELVTA
jgi:hypothetical protein